MAELSVATTYANALYDVASEVGKADRIAEEFEEIAELIQKERELYLLVSSPAVPVCDKQEVIEKLFTGKVSEELVNFLCVVVSKRRGTQLCNMAKQYRKIVNQHEGFATGTIISAIPLTEKQIENFEKQTSALIKENVRLVNEVDGKLIGGVKIYINGKLIDASISTELKNMREAMKSN